MNHALLGQIAGVMAIVQVIPYVISILRGHTKPERIYCCSITHIIN